MAQLQRLRAWRLAPLVRVPERALVLPLQVRPLALLPVVLPRASARPRLWVVWLPQPLERLVD